MKKRGDFQMFFLANVTQIRGRPIEKIKIPALPCTYTKSGGKKEKEFCAEETKYKKIIKTQQTTKKK